MAQRLAKTFGPLMFRVKFTNSYPVCKVCRRALESGMDTFPAPIAGEKHTGQIISPYANNETLHQRNLMSVREQTTLDEFLKFDAELGKELEKLKTVTIPRKSNSLADYVNNSKMLQTLVMFGVRLYHIEKNFPDAMDFLVKLDLNRDVVPKLQFLTKHGLTPKEFGETFTNNPHLLDPKYKIEDFEEIIEYLKSKNFSKEQIGSLLARFSLFLNISVAKLDGILGFFQKLPTNYGNKFIYFGGNELRSLIVRRPSFITANLEEIFFQIKLLERSFNFSLPEIKEIIVTEPSVLTEGLKSLEMRCRFLLEEMNLTKEEIVQSAVVFSSRHKRLETRHYYLKSLGRNQYKPDQKGYVSMKDLVVGDDETFCKKCNVGTLEDYEKFLKTV